VCGTLNALQGIDFTGVFIQFAILVLSLSVHEAAHAWSADRLGDPTARLLGRVSFNPVVHVDPIGTILFPLLAMFTGLPLIGWAKPVPVSIQNLRGNWRQKYMLIAAAGPASNLVLAVIAALLLRAMTLGSPLEVSAGIGERVLFFAIALNVLLAVFNMFPVPPLDGGNVLSGLLTGPAADAFDKLRPYGFIIIYGLMLTGVLFAVLGPIQNALLSFLI
jgi:Zn-dependent protease